MITKQSIGLYICPVSEPIKSSLFPFNLRNVTEKNTCYCTKKFSKSLTLDIRKRFFHSFYVWWYRYYFDDIECFLKYLASILLTSTTLTKQNHINKYGRIQSSTHTKRDRDGNRRFVAPLAFKAKAKWNRHITVSIVNPIVKIIENIRIAGRTWLVFEIFNV